MPLGILPGRLFELMEEREYEQEVFEGKKCCYNRGKTRDRKSNFREIWACSHNKTEEFETDMAETAAKYGVEIIPVYFDLTNDKEIQKGVKEILSVKKEINVLVNNAGITCRALFQMTPVQKARDVFEVDFFAPYLITQILSKKC